ncbi:amino acid adenylation domain-containing protein [Streptomyces cocklensis]|uniref:Amino acid adenylation domain-containing protein n=1 Tax=Actinacidiphila cocklensis TaxID=887465 RepID=A0A9W4GWT1_9ACTN|nr:non-ribosomal peptide synthetase/MFS transporter [Actinacidiphila cocklensis]MDD1057427.1 amino acid adenylation domain-containing protein [Actinacidiphila cocklensis]CAG6399283.1 Amino acid adenylation domain-containing protein [Actinacidiphila cocklensis]
MTTTSGELSAAKKSLLAARLRQAAAPAAAPADVIPARPAGTPVPLSPAQERLWFMEQYAPGTAAYTVPVVLRLRGGLDAAGLAAALDAVAARHESLRMRFAATDDGRPELHIDEAVRIPLETADAAGADPAAREAWVRAAVTARLAEPFDLARGPLLRAALYTLEPGDQVLALTVHHIVCDGWSAELLVGELLALLAADGPQAPPLRRQYGDYALWQRESQGRRLADGAQERDVAYWRDRLAGLPPLDLPTDLPRPARPSFRGAPVGVHLDEASTAALRQSALDRGATLYMAVLAAYAAVLSRYARQDDFAVGSPQAGRTHPELEPLIGMFVSMLITRVDTAGDPTFAELVARVRDTVLDGYAHQELPFEQLVTELDVDRDTSRSAVFQAALSMRTAAAAGRPPAAGIEVEPFVVEVVATRFDLELDLMAGDTLSGALIYNRDLFDGDTVQRIAGTFARFAGEAARDPDRPLSALFASAAGAAPAAWNDTAADFPEDATLHGLVLARAAATPDAPAVCFEGSTLTYGELAERAHRVAGRLRREGARPGRIVAVCAHRGPDLVAALLGVLVSGAAYLPLDPDHPADRLAFMLADAEPVAVLTSGTACDALPPAACPVLALDDPALLAEAADEPGGGAAGPGDPAYVIYTSGSTGQPKGAVNGHRGVVNRLHWMQRRFGLTAADTVLQKTPAGFDVSVWEFFWPLLAGARLVLARPDGHKDAGYLRDLIAAEGVTTAHFVPSMLAVFLAEDGGERCGTLRRVICSGEELPVDLALRTLAALPGAELHNLYGPTEAAIDVTAHRCTARELAGRARVPIGAPIDNMRADVLDEQGRPLPVGVPGELYLAGVGLAHGYLRRPELTAEKFAAGPDGQRRYRTGDLARWRPDGTLEFLGRIDSQVKLRGLRIELGEIEAALREQPGVRDAAVAVREDTPGDRRLAAYLVAGTTPDATPDAMPDATPDATALRTALRRRLPDYMVPATFDELPELPLSTNGKLDRRRLPAPVRVRAVAAAYAEPVTDTEILLADLWTGLLGVPRVGLDDDFFDLGGHSLLAVQVVAALRRAVGAGVTVMDVFAHRTVRELAGLVDVPLDQRGPRDLVHELTRPLPAAQRVRTLVCAPYGGGSAVVYQPLADAMPAGHRLFSIAIPGHDVGLDEAALPLEELAERCCTEILAKAEGPLALYGHCGVGSALIIEIARRLERSGREVDAVYIGAIFPFARPRNRVWSALSRAARMEPLRSDTLYTNWLTGLGVDMNDLEPDQARHLIRTMRQDSDNAEAYYTELMHSGTQRLRAPIISVVGDRDPATEFHAERFTEWHFLTDRTALVVLDEAGHFYLKWRAGELAEIVTGVDPAVTAERTQPLARPARGERATWWLHGTSRSARPVAPTGPQPSMGRFLVVAFAQLISLLGSTLTDVALPLWVLERTGSVLNFALLAVTGLVPSLLAMPIAGAIVDRHSRRRVMLCGDIGAGGTQLLLGILLWTGSLQTWHIYPLLAMLSVALTFQRLAYSSAIPQLVPKQYLGHANGVVQMVGGGATALMPLLSVALLAVIGLGGILVVDVASYAVAVAIVLLVRFPRTLAWRRKESLGTEIREGVRFSWGHRGFRSMLLYFMVLNVFLSPLFLMITPLVLAFADLHQVAEVSVAGGVGALLGGLAMTMWGGPRHRRLHTVLCCSLLLAAFCVVVGLRPTVWVIAAGSFGMSLALVLLNGVYTTIVQVKVPQRFHGRVFAVNTVIAWSTLPIGWAVLGPIGSHMLQPLMEPGGALSGSFGRVLGVGPGRGIALLYLLLAIAIAAVALTAMRLPRTARFDDEVPDARPDDEVGAEAVRERVAAGGAHEGAAERAVPAEQGVR